MDLASQCHGNFKASRANSEAPVEFLITFKYEISQPISNTLVLFCGLSCLLCIASGVCGVALLHITHLRRIVNSIKGEGPFVQTGRVSLADPGTN